MLCGEAVVAIWNGITPEGRETFYDWHLHEHMPERVGIPGFRRGRRYIAETDGGTHPEFFTLYEVETMQVLQGGDYLGRLNAPTPWTRTATAAFRDTARALARVLHSAGTGIGGALLTVRFGAGPAASDALAALVGASVRHPRITGAHLCVADDAASGTRTAETRDRTDIQPAPTWFALIEATDEAALAGLLPDAALLEAGATGPVIRGHYRLEHVRNRTAFA